MALVKGFARATGDLMNWLNSDDLYAPGGLLAVGRHWAENPDALVAASVVHVDESSREENVVHQRGISTASMVRYWRHEAAWQQPGVFFPRRAYERCDGIDETLHFVMDRDLYCRLLQLCPVKYLDTTVAAFRVHSASKTGGSQHRFWPERHRVSQRYWHLVDVDREEVAGLVADRAIRRAGWLVTQGNFSAACFLLRFALQAGGWQRLVRTVLTAPVRVARSRRTGAGSVRADSAG